MNIKLPAFYGIPQWAIYAALALGAFFVLALLAFLIVLIATKAKHKESATAKEPKEPGAPMEMKKKKW